MHCNTDIMHHLVNNHDSTSIAHMIVMSKPYRLHRFSQVCAQVHLSILALTDA